jgi:hypothetical protein
MSQSLLEKLQYKDERNLLIQGLPSSIEKQFVKLAFAKNLTPLLKTRKIDFALVFVVNEQQLGNIFRELLPALQRDAKFWVAYPKIASKIATTLNRDCSWSCITGAGFENVREAAIDHVWTAIRFKRSDAVSVLAKAAIREVALESAGVDHVGRVVREPVGFPKDLHQNKVASPQTRTRRLGKPIDNLMAGKKNPATK